jgi:hypothetical protein
VLFCSAVDYEHSLTLLLRGAVSGRPPFKKQKLNGPIITQYPVPQPNYAMSSQRHQQMLPPRRSLTHPMSLQHVQQQSSPTAPLSPMPSPTNLWQLPPRAQNGMPSSHNQRLTQPGLPKYPPASNFQPATSASPLDISPHQSRFPAQRSLWQHSTSQFASFSHGASLGPPFAPREKYFVKHEHPASPQTGLVGQKQSADAQQSDTQEVDPVELWWEELRSLDFPDEPCLPNQTGKSISVVGSDTC